MGCRVALDGPGHMVWAGAFYSPGSYGSASICHLVEKHFRRRRSVCCRLGRSWGRWGDHCKKRLFGLPGAWHSAVPSWALGDPASWPSVSLSSCTSCPGSPPPHSLFSQGCGITKDRLLSRLACEDFQLSQQHMHRDCSRHQSSPRRPRGGL